jgi:hypothetical protein
MIVGWVSPQIARRWAMAYGKLISWPASEVGSGHLGAYAAFAAISGVITHRKPVCDRLVSGLALVRALGRYPVE